MYIDFSFPHTNILKELNHFPNLKTLYLHCNYIFDLNEIIKLEKLPLLSMTIHGNPVDTIPNFRLYIISVLPYLKKLDTVLISKKERDNANVWRGMFM